MTCYGDLCVKCKKCKSYFKNEKTIKEILMKDKNEIEHHLNDVSICGWSYDAPLQKWFYTPTGQNIEEYMMENIKTTLSPNILKDFMEEQICKRKFKQDFESVIEELTNMQLLSAITNKSDDYGIYIMGIHTKITPKQWRHLIEEAVERFVRGH